MVEAFLDQYALIPSTLNESVPQLYLAGIQFINLPNLTLLSTLQDLAMKSSCDILQVPYPKLKNKRERRYGVKWSMEAYLSMSK